MKRLHSYLTYPFILMHLFIDVIATYALITNYDISFKLVFVVLVINAAIITGVVVMVLDLKRIYLDGNTIYIYDLYSSVPYAIELEQIEDFTRDNSRYSVLWGIYKITVAVEDQHQTFKFMKNKMILNVRKYFEES